MIKLSLNEQTLTDYLLTQLNNFFPDKFEHKAEIALIMPKALERLNNCFAHINRKYYQEKTSDNQNYTVFNHLNSDHYASFLYILSNQAWRENAIVLAEKLFYLNKALNSFDCFYSIELPEIFMLVHPVGTVLGHAKYENYLVVYQNVTVGSTLSGQYPTFSEGCVLYSKASIIGDCHLGKNVLVGANAFILNTQVESAHVIVGVHPSCEFIPSKINVQKDIFLS